LRAETRDQLLRHAFSIPLKNDPGTRAEYSDIGFILLGILLERIAGDSLDQFCQREIFGPLGMSHTAFHPPAAWQSQILPTADDRSFRKRVIQGEVQDENASVMDGVAGHAGVFSTAWDLALFGHVMSNRGAPIVRPETLNLFTRRETSPPGTSRALGWDTPSLPRVGKDSLLPPSLRQRLVSYGPPSQSGQYFSPSSFGHLGYTGTSLWIDPQRQLSVVLLTNRTWPDCSNQAIRKCRPQFHDAVIEALGADR
jgi:serine-type D-Ala-D-Ala carboxypeptidase